MLGRLFSPRKMLRTIRRSNGPIACLEYLVGGIGFGRRH